MAHYEITHRVNYSSVRFYDGHPDRYVASFQIEINGDSGFIHSLTGERFYVHFKNWAPDLFKDLKINSVHFDVLADHLAVMRRLLRDIGEFEILDDVMDSGRPMQWVKFSILAKLKK